jgi:S-adenosylmethionine synthetase
MLQRRLVRLLAFSNPAYSLKLSGSSRHSKGACLQPSIPSQADQLPPQLNVDVCQHLAELGAKLKFILIYISTGKSAPAVGRSAIRLNCLRPSCQDYVFDGTSPPYLPSSATNPVNLYGSTKRDGEIAVLGIQDAKSIALRVPVL